MTVSTVQDPNSEARPKSDAPRGRKVNEIDYYFFSSKSALSAGIPALEDAGLVYVEARHQDATGEHEIGQGEAREGLRERLPSKHAIGELDDGEHHREDQEQDVERAFRQPNVGSDLGPDP